MTAQSAVIVFYLNFGIKSATTLDWYYLWFNNIMTADEERLSRCRSSIHIWHSESPASLVASLPLPIATPISLAGVVHTVSRNSHAPYFNLAGL
jgi:hypothetical protein